METEYRTKNNKGVWNWARITFYGFLLVCVISWLIPYESITDAGYGVIGLFALGTLIPAFVLSIIHLNKYKEKGFAVTSLVITSLWILYLLLYIFSIA